MLAKLPKYNSDNLDGRAQRRKEFPRLEKKSQSTTSLQGLHVKGLFAPRVLANMAPNVADGSSVRPFAFETRSTVKFMLNKTATVSRDHLGPSLPTKVRELAQRPHGHARSSAFEDSPLAWTSTANHRLMMSPGPLVLGLGPLAGEMEPKHKHQ